MDIKTLEIIIVTNPQNVTIESYRNDQSKLLLGKELLENAAQQNIGRDTLYSTAYRLVGFGLALEVPAQTGRRDQNDLRFIPTQHGRTLYALLKGHSEIALQCA